ncbi:PRC-barrel domain-containing protein [Candidatus Bathyarchaeota archaeon]|nr:PRC-barrel domain-containing protein [Candidatus Bathyarchaeota archaeon]
MHIDQLMKRAVMGSDAFVVGHVNDIEFDEKSMKLTSICLKLDDKAIEPMGLKKPRLGGNVRIAIPVSVIKAIGDVVNLDRSAGELGALAKRR